MENQLPISSMNYHHISEQIPYQEPNNYQQPALPNTYQPLRRTMPTSYSRPTQMVAFNPSQNVMMVNQGVDTAFNPSQNIMMVNQGMPQYPPQTMLLRNSQGVFNPGGYKTGPTSQVELMDSCIDWIDPAHKRILLLKMTYEDQSIIFLHRAQAKKQRATDTAALTSAENERIWAVEILNFFNLSTSDLLHWTKYEAYKTMKNIMLFFNPEASKLLRERHAQQVQASGNHLELPQIQQRENNVQFNNPAASLHQSSRLQEISATHAVSSSRANQIQFNPVRYNCPDDKQSSTTGQDPLMEVLRAFKQTSPSADKSTTGDLGAVTDLADNISNYDNGNFGLVCTTSMNSGMKRQAENITWDDLTTEEEFCTIGRIKRLKTQSDDHLLQEINEINRKLIELDVNVMIVNGSNEGTIVRCSYFTIGQTAETKTPDLPNMFVDLIVGADYPNSSPILLETEPSCCSDGEEGINLCMKAKAKFSSSLEKLPQPISLTQMAETWNACVRQVFVEFEGKMGRGDFSSTWDVFP